MNWIWKDFQALSNDELYDLLQARQKVFLLEQKIICLELDGRDRDAFHLLGYRNGQIEAYLRALPYALGVFKVGRVLTITRGKGFGQALMREAEVHLLKAGAHTIKLSAQAYLEKFYVDLGYQTTSEPYLEEGILHIAMEKSLTDRKKS